MKRFLAKIFAILHKVKAAIFSKSGVIITGALSLIYIGAMAGLFITSINNYNNPSLACGKEFRSLRQEILQSGTAERNPRFIERENYGKNFVVVTKEHQGETFRVLVSSEDKYSNFLGISTVRLYDGYGLGLCFGTAWFLEDTYVADENYIFYVQAVIAKADGTPYYLGDTDIELDNDYRYSCNTSFNLIELHPLDDVWGIDVDQAIVDDINQNAPAIIEEFITHITPVLEQFQSHNIPKIFAGLQKGMLNSIYCSSLLIIAAFLSVIGGPILCLFGFGLANLIHQKNAAKLLANGPLETVVEENVPASTPTEIPPSRAGPLQKFVEKTHIRPVLGEWVIRGLGLALLIVGSVFMSLINKELLPAGVENYYPLFSSLHSMGSFLLVIAVIGIIAETRKNLTVLSAFFFTLAVTYYLAVTSALFFVDTVDRYDFAGISFSSLISTFLPGNIFMGLGLFTFIGFFLFEEPPRWFKKRKLFRSLSAIPTSVALASVVFSFLRLGGIVEPNYWISTILFVSAFDSLFVGVIYLYTIFIFRTILKKRHGRDRVDDVMARPWVQFQKNICLCLIVLAYTALFYTLPADIKHALALPDHTFIYFLIPLLLFYKPAGKNRKAISNVIYYTLYIIGAAFPSVLGFILGS